MELWEVEARLNDCDRRVSQNGGLTSISWWRGSQRAAYGIFYDQAGLNYVSLQAASSCDTIAHIEGADAIGLKTCGRLVEPAKS